VAAARAKWGFVPSNVVIGSMGRLEPQKRFDLLMEAFAALHRERPELRMLIAGEGTARDLLEKKAHALGIRDNCRLIGHCANVADFHHAIDHFVQSSDYEGTPNVVLEAMAMKSPVVATTAGGTGEIVENDVHGTLVPCGDAEALARAIDRTLTDPAATARRTRAARTRVENDLSFDARMRRVEAIYERLAGRGVW
jgi:glycosyltransferase involved in cell wall biosynthesis